jgi:hypothetical protein
MLQRGSESASAAARRYFLDGVVPYRCGVPLIFGFRLRSHSYVKNFTLPVPSKGYVP